MKRQLIAPQEPHHEVDIADALADTVVIDATNPLSDDLSGLVTDEGSAGVQLDGYIAGDDDGAKQVVADLLEATGYRTIDVGGLRHARYLEGMAYLNIARNAHRDLPWQSGWKLLGPAV